MKNYPSYQKTLFTFILVLGVSLGPYRVQAHGHSYETITINARTCLVSLPERVRFNSSSGVSLYPNEAIYGELYCPIPTVEGGQFTHLEVVFYDPDGRGRSSRVTVTLSAAPDNSRNTEILASFNSNEYDSTEGRRMAKHSVSISRGGYLDFLNNSYIVRVRLHRRRGEETPTIRTIRLVHNLR